MCNILPDDIKEHDVRLFFIKKAIHNKPKCFYIASPGIGEMITQTPILRSLSTKFDIILVMREEVISPFEHLPFVFACIRCQPHELDYNVCSENVKISDSLMQKLLFARNSGDYLTSSLLLPEKYFQTFLKPNFYTGKFFIPNATHLFSSIAGIDVDDSSVQIEFKRIALALPDSKKKKIGLCMGSHEKMRRLSKLAFRRICEDLHTKYDVYLFGLNHDNIVGSIETLRVCDKTNTTYSYFGLLETLNYISKMDIFVSPDSGLMHCALALGRPTVCIESISLLETEVDMKYLDKSEIVSCSDYKLKCLRNCHAQLCKANAKCGNRPIRKFEEILVNSPNYSIECNNMDLNTVECLDKIHEEVLSGIDMLEHRIKVT